MPAARRLSFSVVLELARILPASLRPSRSACFLVALFGLLATLNLRVCVCRLTCPPLVFPLRR